MIQSGDIAFSGKRKPGFYSRTVMRLTKSKWSHCFPVVGTALDQLSVLESDLDVTMVSFHEMYELRNIDYYEMWRPTKATQDAIKAAGEYVYINFAEEEYGFLQPLWFMLRQLGFPLHRNFFRSGLVCSGLLYEYMKRLGPEYADTLKNFDAYNSSPQDLYDIVRARTDLFTFVLMRQ